MALECSAILLLVYPNKIQHALCVKSITVSRAHVSKSFHLFLL